MDIEAVACVHNLQYKFSTNRLVVSINRLANTPRRPSLLHGNVLYVSVTIKTKMATSMRIQMTCIHRLWPTCTIPRRVLQTTLATCRIDEYKLSDSFAPKRLSAASALVSRCGLPPRLSVARSCTACPSSLRPVSTFSGPVFCSLSAEKFWRLPFSSAASLMTQSSRNWRQVRAFSSGSGDEFSSSSSSSDGDEGEGGGSEDGSPVPDVTVGGDLPPSMVALSPMTVPEVWPRVPVIAVRRHPLFPRFIKMIEVFMSRIKLQKTALLSVQIRGFTMMRYHIYIDFLLTYITDIFVYCVLQLQ